MLTIMDEGSLSCALNSPIDPRLKSLLAERRDQVGYEYPLEELANWAVLAPGETLADLERHLGFAVAGEAAFPPEWVEDRGFAWECCWILDDSGFGHIAIVPKEPGMDAALLEFCASQASESART